MSDIVWVKELTPDALAPVTGLQGRWHRWVTPTEENRGMIFAMGQLLPNEVAGWHVHPEPEVFFVLEGRGEARWREGEEEHHAELRPGVAFYKIGGVPHQMINLGSTPLIGIALKVADV
ncbi:MAG: cupin domain-containing protein [Anaerolineales bacterium]|nr:cupin domain-containing protein [Anaerolineales bacterium]